MSEPGLKVLVVAADAGRGRNLGQALAGQGLALAGVAATAAAAHALAADSAPDLVLVDLPAPTAADLEMLHALGRSGRPLVLLCGRAGMDFVAQAQAAGASACLVGPQEPDALAAALELAQQTHARELRLAREVDELRDGLRRRKLLERAKGLIMQQLGVGYAEAEARLAAQAANQGLTPQQAAEALVAAADGPPPEPRRYVRS